MDHAIANGATNWGTTVSAKAFANLSSNVTVSLTGGVDGTISTANVVTAYDAFDSAESVDISLVVSGPANQTLADSLISMCVDRKDCLVFLSPEKADVVNNPGDEVTDTVAYRNTLTSSSYAVLDGNWKYQYDKYNDVYRWIPCNGDIAGLCARTDLERDPWFSPGGLNRGILKNVIKLAYNPTKTNRDDLYVKGINPIVSFQGEGTVLFGDKTMLSKPSAFDRINVRRLFIVLEKAIARAARFSLFEFNDQFTRAQFVALVEPFLRDVQGRRGITDFRVVCDETNNTGEVIDRNEFVGDIYIKPARSINFIQLNFVAVRTGVSFDEVVGQF
jgi:phage tail sheath protein FI